MTCCGTSKNDSAKSSTPPKWLCHAQVCFSPSPEEPNSQQDKPTTQLHVKEDKTIVQSLPIDNDLRVTLALQQQVLQEILGQHCTIQPGATRDTSLHSNEGLSDPVPDLPPPGIESGPPLNTIVLSMPFNMRWNIYMVQSLLQLYHINEVFQS